jgi:hypothetical protein
LLLVDGRLEAGDSRLMAGEGSLEPPSKGMRGGGGLRARGIGFAPRNSWPDGKKKEPVSLHFFYFAKSNMPNSWREPLFSFPILF